MPTPDAAIVEAKATVEDNQGGAHRVTSETERKRAEAQAARERLVGTVNELGTAVQDAKQRARERAVRPPRRTSPAAWA